MSDLYDGLPSSSNSNRLSRMGYADWLYATCRERGKVIRQLCKGTPSGTWHQRKCDSFAREPPSHHNDSPFTQLLLPSNLAQWLATSLEITFTASASWWHHSFQWIPAVGNAICVRFTRTPREQRRLLWHCLPSSYRRKGKDYFLELAVVDVSMPGRTVATRQVPIYGGWLYPNQACACFAWQSGPSTVVVTGMLDLLDVAIIQLTGPIRCSPAVMSGGALSSSMVDALQINWSASGNLMAITRTFCSVIEVLQDEELPPGEVRDQIWITSADCYFCNASDGQVLHQAVVEEPATVESCFSHDGQHFAIWGRQEGAESPWAQLLLLNTASWTWQHASLSAPVPLDCKQLVWGPDSSWLACSLRWHNDDPSSEDGLAGDTCHERACAADRAAHRFWSSWIPIMTHSE